MGIKPRNRLEWFATLAILLLVCAVAVRLLNAKQSVMSRAVGKSAALVFLMNLVDRELPPGTTRAEVEAWLDARGVPHFAAEPVKTSATAEEEMLYAGLTADRVSAAVVATFEHQDLGFPLYGPARVTFFFGKDGKQVKHRVVRP